MLYNQKSFTLIELIVVIAIIAILAAIIAPNAFRAIEKAKIAAALSDVKTFKSTFYAYYSDTGQWPPGSGGYIISGSESAAPYLMVNTGNVSGWDGPYIEKLKLSPWSTWYTVVNELTFGGNYQGVNLAGIDIVVSINDDPNNRGVPRPSMIKLDQMLDDGDLTTGTVVEGVEVGQIGIGIAEIGRW